MENSSGLLTLQSTAKRLGITKKAVLSLVDSGELKAVSIGEKVMITPNSIAALLHINDSPDFVSSDNGYQAPEELQSSLTKTDEVDSEKEVMQAVKYSGCVSALKDGRFMVQTYLTGGKREGIKSKSFRDEAEANEYLRKRLNELNSVVAPVSQSPAPTYSPSPYGSSYTQMTFEQYALSYLKKGGTGRVSSMTLENYRRAFVPINKLIGKRPIAELTKDDLIKAFSKLCTQVSDSAVQKAYTATKLLLQTAFDEGDVPFDFTRRWKRPKSRIPQKPKESPTFSDDDLRILFEKSKEWGPELYAQITLLACTGMRPEEIRALEWIDFDEVKKTISIRQAAVHVFDPVKTMDKQPKSREEISVTKSAYSRRTLHLSDIAVQALKEWRRELRSRKNWAQAHSSFIFPNRDGDFKTSAGFESVLKRFRRKYNLDYMGLHFYKFRHTMCTNLVLDGQPIPVIQRIMGDNTTDMILKTYAHVSEEKALKSSEDYYKRMNETHSQIAFSSTP